MKWGPTRGSGALLSVSLLSIAIALGGAASATAQAVIDADSRNANRTHSIPPSVADLLATPTATPTPTVAPTATPTPGMKMYQGSLSLHFFGNDTTVRVTPPFNAYVFAALPLGAHCNPAVSGGMTCTTATLQMGAPLTGSGSALVGGGSPASIMLSSSQLGRITSGSLPQQYSSQVYRKTYVNLANAKGSFQPGKGPGNLSYSATLGLGARIFAGRNQFGGVMRLLSGAPSGGLGTKARYTMRSAGTWATSRPWEPRSWVRPAMGAFLRRVP